jgi:hypothetical protein
VLKPTDSNIVPRTTGVWVLPKPRAESPNDNIKTGVHESEERRSRNENVKRKHDMSVEGAGRPWLKFRS